MNVHELFVGLSQMDREMDAAEALATHEATAADLPFWRQMVCTGLRILRTQVRLSAEQDDAWEVVMGVLCDGA